MRNSLICSLLMVLSFASLASAGIIWNVTYADVTSSNGRGFNDATQGATRRTTFESALSYVSSVLQENGTVNFRVDASLTGGNSFLAAAGSNYFTPTGFQTGLVQQSIQSTLPSSVSGPVGSAQFDFGYNWNSTLAAPSASQFDLYSVSLHEITHALGFASLISPTGASQFGNGTSGTFSNFDPFLQNGTSPLFTGSGFTATADLNGDGVADALQSNKVVFTGANAVAANGGNPVAIYSPATYRPGSSLSHITSGTSVMQFSIGPGRSRRQYSAIDLGILKDIGYSNISAVPEPSSIAFVSLIVLVGTTKRFRKKHTQA
jgi:hypothetical protein